MTDQDMNTMEKVKNEAQTADCDACGGDMAYDPEKKSLVCKFCGNIQEIDFTSEDVQEISFEALSSYDNDVDWDMPAKVIECKNCGGQTVAEAEDETAYCSFCGSQHMVVSDKADKGIKPQGVVPYEVSYESARAKMDKWVKRRWLAPNDLKDRFRGKNLKGVYMPYWTFDSQVNAQFTCRVGDYYYVGSGDERKRKTRWRSYGGAESKFFDDVLVLGIDSDEASLMKKIEPFNTSKNKVMDYKPDFLAGYLAKKHTIKPSPAFNVAKEQMKRDIAAQIKRGLPGDTYDNYHQTVRFSRETFKHILLPVYMSAYDYNNKLYRVLINGQTGEVQGKAPLSPIKVAGLVILGIIIAAVVMTFSNT